MILLDLHDHSRHNTRQRQQVFWPPFAMATSKPPIDHAKLDRIVAEARRSAEQRDRGYREQALKMYPWICGRCAREFTRANLVELTVHHRNHNHDDNPADGSNWELLCVYCHDNERQTGTPTIIPLRKLGSEYSFRCEKL